MPAKRPSKAKPARQAPIRSEKNPAKGKPGAAAKRATLLTPESYDRYEREGSIGLSHFEVAAFSPLTFQIVGFPDRITDTRELPRYSDWNRDIGNQYYFRRNFFFEEISVQTDFTFDEADMINEICDSVVGVTRELGRPVRPLCNPMSQIGLFRIVMALAKAYRRDTLTILEIGPGSGYLGAMLIKRGFRYFSMDNAQAFYLWQNALFSHLAGKGNFLDLVESESWEGRNEQVVRIPWWKFVKIYDYPPIKADIVISNSNLGEMNADALRFVMRMSRKMLCDSDIGQFIYANIGGPVRNDQASVDYQMEQAGFREVFSKLFYGYSASGKKVTWKAGALQKKIPLFDPSGRGGVLGASDFLFLPPNQRPLDLDFTENLEGWVPPVPETRQNFGPDNE